MIGPIIISLLLLPVVLGLPTHPRADIAPINTTETVVGPRWVSLTPDFRIPGEHSSARLDSTTDAPILSTPSPLDNPTDPTIIASARTSSASLHRRRARAPRETSSEHAFAASLVVEAPLARSGSAGSLDERSWIINPKAKRAWVINPKAQSTETPASSPVATPKPTSSKASSSTKASSSRVSSSARTSSSMRTTSTTRASSTTAKVSTTTKAVAIPTATGKVWQLAKQLSTVSSFLSNVKQIGSWAFGAVNAGYVATVPASAYTSGKSDGTNDLPALSALYPKGSYSPGNTPQGGVGFYGSPIAVSAASNLSFSYSVFFPKNFDFVMGGKLPGLYGGKKGCSGGDTAETCFSSRLMFRTGGLGELYLYAPREKQVAALCTLKPLSYCNAVDGMSIGRGSWTFKTGEWTNVRQDVWLNTPGVANGGFNIWINNKLVLTSSSVYFRNTAAGGIFNGTAPPPIPLIDYDSLPANVVIPNGGLVALPMPSTVRSRTSATVAIATATFSSQVRRNVVELVRERGQVREGSDDGELEKRASLLPFSFSGFMFHTFFGGSNTNWASPKIQYTYYNQLGLKINS